jgi:hypothetical protein
MRATKASDNKPRKAETMKTMDHAGYPKRCRKMTDAELRFTISDARQAAEAGKGWNDNVGYYLDEIHYCSMELSRRQKQAK